MGLWKKTKQYGNLLIALMMTIGFGATFMIYAAGAPSGQSPEDSTEELNYEIPESTYTEEGFDKNFQEQAVIAAQNDVAVVTVMYDNESQLESIEDMRPINNVFGEKAYIQVIDSGDSLDIPTQAEVTEYPAAVVIGGSISQRGISPTLQSFESGDFTRTDIEREICRAISDLQGIAAHCRSIGAF